MASNHSLNTFEKNKWLFIVAGLVMAIAVAGMIFIGPQFQNKDKEPVVKKGEEITETISKALQKLDIKPFEINVNIPVILEGGLLFTDEILSIDEERFSKMLKNSLSNYYYLSIELGMPTKDNINSLLQKAYRNSFILSIERNIIYPETAEEIIKKAELAKRRIEKEMDGERKEG